MKGLVKYLKNSGIPMGYWFVLMVFYAFFFATMVFADLCVTYEHGVLLCDSIFTGKFFDFYDHACTGVYNNPAVYDIGIYLIWAIWALPVYILTRFWHVAPAETPILILYGKGLVVIFHFLTLAVVMKIADVMKLDAKKKAMLMFAYISSLCMIVSSIGNGQFDIIPTFFIVLGVYYYIKNDYKKFLIVMTFAISFKIFAVFIAIPLVLYKEKRILYIIRDGIVLLLASAFFKALFWGKQRDYYNIEYFHSPDQYTNGWLYRMFKIRFPGGIGEISLFILFFVLICGCAYFLRKREEKEIETVLLYAFLAYLNFFLFIAAHPQWIVLFIPFLYLFALARKEHYRLNMILATLIDVMFFICLSYQWKNVFFSSNVLRGLEIVIPFPETTKLGGSFRGFVDSLGYEYMYPGLVAVLVAVCAVFIYRYFSKEDRFIEIREEKYEQKMMLSRTVLIGVYTVINVLLCYV